MRAATWVCFGVFVWALSSSSQGHAVEAPKPVVLPPGATVHGKTLGEWSAEWWRWLLAIPEPESPAKDPIGARCHLGQKSPVFFIPGSFGETYHRSCTVPCGQYVFFPIVNDLEWSPTHICSDCQQCRGIAQGFMDQVAVLECEIDGEAVPDLGDHREESPCFDFTVPDNNVLGLAAGTYGPAVSDGFWIMIEPMAPGNHTLHFRGVVGPVTQPSFMLEIFYDVLAVESCTPTFRRGDANADGKVDIGDPVASLNYLFLGASAPPCEDAADSQDDGKIDLSDAVATLSWLFLGGASPSAPGPTSCGSDPSEDELTRCDSVCE